MPKLTNNRTRIIELLRASPATLTDLARASGLDAGYIDPLVKTLMRRNVIRIAGRVPAPNKVGGSQQRVFALRRLAHGGELRKAL